MPDLSPLCSRSFNWHLASTLSQACKLAYGHTEVFERILRRGWEADHCTFISSSTCRVHLVEAGPAQMLVFADSVCLGEWLAAFSSLDQRAPFGTGEVLSQVSQGYLAIRKALWELLSSHPNSPGSTLWLTGHGVGGALAMMAAADFVIEEHPLTGVISLGNPRFVDAIFKAWFKEVMDGRCVSLFNAEDLLPKIPSGWKHPGRSIVFDPHVTSRSKPKHQFVESLPKKDWDVLLGQIRNLLKQKANSDENLDAGLLRLDNTSCAPKPELLDLAPSLNFNSIDRYTARIRRRIPNNTLDLVTLREAESCIASHSDDKDKIASTLVYGVEAFSQITGNQQAIHVSESDSILMPVLIQLNSAEWTAPEYVRKSTSVGAYVSALVPATKLELLQMDPGVNSIVVSRESSVPELDLSVPFVKADQVHRPPIAETGDHALVGIIDNGIDVRHQAFTNRSGHTRILGIWDQVEASGPSPHMVDPDFFSQNYGTLYTHKQVEAMRDGTSSIPSRLLSPDICAHGTHVAGIAAGRAVGEGADGMAPEAGILLVMPKLQAQEGDPQSIGYSMSHVDAAAFLIRAAQGANILVPERLPIAVNMSLGMQAGPHDGMSVLETFFDTLTTKGTAPGCVIIKSAGNEQLSNGHARINLSQGQEAIVTWNSNEGDRHLDYIEAWYDFDDTLEFKLVDPSGNESGVVSSKRNQLTGDLSGNPYSLDLQLHSPENGDNRLSMRIMKGDGVRRIQAGSWHLIISGVNVLSENHCIDLWIETTSGGPFIQFSEGAPYGNLTVPGTAESVITVGACDSSVPVQLLERSSRGSTRGEKFYKPDLCAPGRDIDAPKFSLNSDSDYIAKSGTSMAAPHVTGALALVLSRRHKTNPKAIFNAVQLKKALKKSLLTPNVPHDLGMGWGVLDALRLYRLLEELP